MNTVTTPHAAAAQGAAVVPASAPSLRNMALVIAALLLPVLVYFGTAQSIVAIWERSGTFAHGFVIMPISLWLIWRRRDDLAALPIQPCWAVLPVLLACGAAWLLGALGDVQIVRQYALACMMPLTVIGLLGTRMARVIAFPLVFILLGVPVGEGLIAPLIDITAGFTIDALRLTGIPVLRDGNSFSIPSGNWSVVEACSGLRYLISSITLGCLYAHLSYRSRRRQLLFVLAATLIPIAANSVRAYMIVMIGHLSGMKLAVGVDHLIYGWVFFGLVMLLLFWVGSFWREDQQQDPSAPAVPLVAVAQPLPVSRLAGATLALLLAIGVWPAYAALMERGNVSVPPVTLADFASPSPLAPAFSTWQPEYPPATAVLRQYYQGEGQPVGLHVMYYRDQAGGGRLVSSTNHIGPEHTAMRENTVVQRNEQVAGGTLMLREALIGFPGNRLLVWQYYWIHGQKTSSNYVGKWLQVEQKLLTGSDDGASVMVFAAYDEDPTAARAALRAFLNANMAALDATLASKQRR
jgi:exosortase A